MHDFEILNSTLEQAHQEMIQGYSSPDFPVTFVLSQPRAASALLIQLIFTKYKIGYSSNLISKFWKAPCFGVSLHKNLEIETQGTNFSTGLTIDGAFEPHEWGYFWRHWFKLSGEEHYTTRAEEIDTKGLVKTIAAMENRFEAPLIFDSPFFHCNYPILSKSFANSIYIRTWRDPFYICNSIINARLKRHGNVDGFYGNVPKSINQIRSLEDPIEQIVSQVYETEKEIDEVYMNIPEEQKLTIKYSDMTAHPSQAVEQFHQKLGIKLTPRHINLPDSLKSRDCSSLINPKYKDKLNKYFKKYFNYLPPS